MLKVFDLNQGNPADVSLTLARCAQQFTEDAGELQSAWQDPQAGKVWEELARELERSSERCKAIAAKHGFAFAVSREVRS